MAHCKKKKSQMAEQRASESQGCKWLAGHHGGSEVTIGRSGSCMKENLIGPLPKTHSN